MGWFNHVVFLLTLVTLTAALGGNPCSPNPCKHGTCYVMYGKFACKCDPGWMGRRCRRAEPGVWGEWMSVSGLGDCTICTRRRDCLSEHCDPEDIIRTDPASTAVEEFCPSIEGCLKPELLEDLLEDCGISKESDSSKQSGTKESDSSKKSGTKESDSSKQSGTKESDSSKQSGTKESGSKESGSKSDSKQASSKESGSSGGSDEIGDCALRANKKCSNRDGFDHGDSPRSSSSEGSGSSGSKSSSSEGSGSKSSSSEDSGSKSSSTKSSGSSGSKSTSSEDSGSDSGSSGSKSSVKSSGTHSHSSEEGGEPTNIELLECAEECPSGWVPFDYILDFSDDNTSNKTSKSGNGNGNGNGGAHGTRSIKSGSIETW